MRSHRKGPEKPVHSISSVPTSTADDQDARIRTYLLSMGIRTACFFIAVVIFAVAHSVWLTLIFIFAAVILPYPAVVFANNAGNRQSHFVQPASSMREIGTAEDRLRSPGPGEHW